MLSPVDLERLIAVKRREIEKEKTLLGLSVTTVDDNTQNDNEYRRQNEPRTVKFEDKVWENNDTKTEDKKERDSGTQDRDRDLPCSESEAAIPADLERYIRRYIGLPVMLKAGEYSPNNPLVRAERSSGDVLLGLGEYERRRNTLRKLRQQQYREYLDQQAKKKQESRAQQEKERREREEREREREEREREKELLERERTSPGRRRVSVSYANNSGYCSNKVDTGVQVDSLTSPLSVAVQTDDADFFQLPPSPSKSLLTQAERELSPRTVADPQDDRRIQPAPWTMTKWQDDTVAERRRSYGDFDERSSSICKRTPRERLVSDLRHSYMPSIFDADAIHMRNLQAEKEAAERRQFYQQELKNQILEQQRIKEERKTREKMLEQAEMRRLEEQLRMLRVAQEREVGKHQEISAAMNDEEIEYAKKRTDLQKEIDIEQQSLLRASTHPPLTQRTCHSDTNSSNLPFYYPRLKTTNDKPYSTNIPDNSIFSPNYDVDSYLRRNLNFRDNRFSHLRRGSVQNIDIENIGNKKNENKNVIVEKAIVHDIKDCKTRNLKKKETDPFDDSLPIPVLRHSPLSQVDKAENDNLNDAMKIPLPPLRHSPISQGDKVETDSLSDAMKIVDDKWKVPAVQKNILRSLPNEEGKNVSILTQLGSIRRQLQLEQLKLDKLNKEDDV